MRRKSPKGRGCIFLRLFANTAAGLGATAGLGLALFLYALPSQAQGLSNEIVVSLPPETVHVELVRLSRLRELSSYKTLREQYTSSRLAELQDSLQRLGIRDTDIDEILLAWEPVPSEKDGTESAATAIPPDLDANGGWIQNHWPTFFGGLAAGWFSSKSISKNAAENNVPRVSIGDSKAYCVTGKAPVCVVLIDESLGAFGSEANLRKIISAREGRGPDLVSSPDLLGLVERVPPEPSLWGVARGSGIADWFSSWPLVGGNAQLNWEELLKSVEALEYSLSIGDKIHLKLKLNCKDSATATRLAQAFRGLRLLQTWMWQKERPSEVNPVENMDVQSSSDDVLVVLTTSESALRKSKVFFSRTQTQ